MALCTPAAAAPVSEKLNILTEQWDELKQHCEAEQEHIKGMWKMYKYILITLAEPSFRKFMKL